MTYILTLSILMTTNMFIMFILHPLAMTISIIIQTLMSCLILGFFSHSMWFSYILFLTFLGGMLVLFIYTTSLASNEIFNISFFFNLLIFIFMISILSSYFFINYYHFSPFLNQDSLILSPSPFSELPQNLHQLYNSPNFIITLTLILYLLLTLIIIVKITNIKQGSLRHSLN